MPENKNERKNVSLSDILGDSSGLEHSQKPPESRVNKTLDEIIDIKKKAIELRTLEGLDGSSQGGGSSVSAAEEIVDLMTKLGVNPANMAAAQAEEMKQLRASSTAQERELHQMRLDRMMEVEERVKKTLSDFAEKQKAIAEIEKTKSAGLLGGDNPVNSLMNQFFQEAIRAKLNPPTPPNPFDEMAKWTEWQRKMQLLFMPAQSAVDPSLALWNGNVEMYKTKTNFDIEMAKMNLQKEADAARTKSLTDMAQKFLDILPDAFAAYGEAVGKKKDNSAPEKDKKPPQSRVPSHPKDISAAPLAPSNEELAKQIGDFIEGECPHCHKIIPVPAKPPKGVTALCPYCKGAITFINEEEPPTVANKPEVPGAPPLADANKPEGGRK